MNQYVWTNIRVNDDAQIWRYFKPSRFLDFLECSEMYYASANEFQDTFEGAVAVLPPEFQPDPRYAEPDMLEQAIIPLKKHSKINCWHIEEHENSMMWEMYGQRGQGVAICSTVGNLLASYTPYCASDKSLPETLYHGPVQYKDLLSERLRPSQKERFFYKDRIFKHEQEYRFMIALTSAAEWGVPTPDNGIFVRFNPRTMINGIVFGPALDQEYQDRILAASEQHSLSGCIRKSRLLGTPKYI